MASESLIQVDVISRSVIKPSSPTPDHLRHFKLSLLDQLAAPVYVAGVSLYEANELKGLTTNTDHGKLIQNLQDSLSKALTQFYPLAGRLDAATFSVDCNDDGVDFVEARVNSRLEDLAKGTKLDQVEKYFPANPVGGLSAGEGKIFLVQINYFSCGGIAVGSCMSHYFGDGWSMIEFLNTWAATCRGEQRDTPYQFGQLGHHFPAIDLSGMIPSPGPLNDQAATKIFVFDKDQLAALKKVAEAPGEGSIVVADPTRVEALSAFIWKNSIDNYLAEGKKRFSATHVVNIRSRANKSLQLEHVIGNAMVYATAFADRSGTSAPPSLPELVSKLRNAIRNVDEEYVDKTRTELLYLKETAARIEMMKRGEIEELFMFSSWTRFPTYEVDFGWGPPVWNCSGGLGLKDNAGFVTTRDGEGIEVWMSLLPKHAESLEQRMKLIGSDS